MGQADYYAPGDYNAQCYQCSRKFKFSMLTRNWQGYYVCPEHWEPRQPQDFVRGIPDNQAVPQAQPWPAPEFAPFCTSTSAISGIAEAGCMIAGSSLIPSWYNTPPGS